MRRNKRSADEAFAGDSTYYDEEQLQQWKRQHNPGLFQPVAPVTPPVQPGESMQPPVFPEAASASQLYRPSTPAPENWGPPNTMMCLLGENSAMLGAPPPSPTGFAGSNASQEPTKAQQPCYAHYIHPDVLLGTGEQNSDAMDVEMADPNAGAATTSFGFNRT